MPYGSQPTCAVKRNLGDPKANNSVHNFKSIIDRLKLLKMSQFTLLLSSRHHFQCAGKVQGVRDDGFLHPE